MFARHSVDREGYAQSPTHARLPADRPWRATLAQLLCVALPKVLGGGCAVAANLVLLRHFGPPSFGVYSLCVAAIVLVDSTLGSAIDTGVLRLAPLFRRTDPLRSLAVQRAALTLKLALASAAGLGLALLAGPIRRHLFHGEGDVAIILLSCGAVLALLALRSAQVHLQLEGRFGLYGALDLLQTVFKFGGIAAALAFGETSLTVVVAFLMVGPAVAFLAFLATPGRVVLGRPTSVGSALPELLGFVKWFVLTFGLAAALNRLDLFLLSAWSTIHEVGLFAGGYTLAVVFDLLGAYLSVVLSPRVMPYWREGRFTAYYRRFQRACLIGCGCLYLLTALVFPLLASALLPPSYQPSAGVFLALLPGTMAALATFPLTLTFVLFVRPRFLFVMDALSAPVLVLLYAWAIPRHGAVGAAWVTSLARLLKLSFAQVVAWRWAGAPCPVPSSGGAVADRLRPLEVT
jgi:O-antigen/teichoic acid export membrane protein